LLLGRLNHHSILFLRSGMAFVGTRRLLASGGDALLL
jgi:hypothetical protein